MKATSFSMPPLGLSGAVTTIVAIALATAACASDVEPPAPTPAPSTPVAAQSAAQVEPTPAPEPSPTPAAPPEPVYENYLDAPQTPGTWAYIREPGETLAMFGQSSAAPIFLVRCADGIVSLARVTGSEQSQPRVMNVTAETGSRQLEAAPVTSRPVILAADLQPSDSLLDAIAITKGRFMVDVEGEKPLYLPAWVEVTRVIEDCR